MNDVTIAIKVSNFSFTHDYLTQLLALNPSKIHKKNDSYFSGPPNNKKEKKYEYDYWEYRLHIKSNDVWLKIIIDKFIEDIISPRREAFGIIKEKCELEIYIGVYYRDISVGGLDSFSFESSILSLLGQLNIALEIDQYSFLSSA